MTFEQRFVINTRDLSWTPAPGSGVELKQLDEFTQLLRLAPKGELSFEGSAGEECLILGGSVSYNGGELDTGTYLRFPPASSPFVRSELGCTLFLKQQAFAVSDAELVVRQTRQMAWLPGQGRLEVMPLHEHEGRSTALVRWPAEERFVPHKHWGGEEIFVLSGTFMDEHGAYPAGTWLRNPHLSQHHPFVEKETIILVKVGHLG